MSLSGVLKGSNSSTLAAVIFALCVSAFLSGCQASGSKVSDGDGRWPGLLDDNPLTRTQTVHLIRQSGDRDQVPLLFPLLNDRDRWVRYNARATILILAGPHRDTAPAYNYLSERSLLKKAPEEHRTWWNNLYPGALTG